MANISVWYEWDVEEVADGDSDDLEDGEVIEHWFQESYSGCLFQMRKEPNDGTKWQAVLVCNTDDSRSWAYLQDDGTLPEFFEDAYQQQTRKVPKRFHEEVFKAAKVAV